MIRKNSKKIMCKLFMLSFVILALTGCSSKKPSGQAPKMSSLKEDIENSVDVSNMDIGVEEDLDRFYNIDAENLEEFLIYIPKTNIAANEIAILKVKDSTDIDDIKERISDRIKNQSNNFEDYLPDEHFLIEKHILKSQDNYILFVISEDAETVEDIFNKSFQ